MKLHGWREKADGEVVRPVLRWYNVVMREMTRGAREMSRLARQIDESRREDSDGPPRSAPPPKKS